MRGQLRLALATTREDVPHYRAIVAPPLRLLFFQGMPPVDIQIEDLPHRSYVVQYGVNLETAFEVGLHRIRSPRLVIRFPDGATISHFAVSVALTPTYEFVCSLPGNKPIRFDRGGRMDVATLDIAIPACRLSSTSS